MEVPPNGRYVTLVGGKSGVEYYVDRMIGLLYADGGFLANHRPICQISMLSL